MIPVYRMFRRILLPAFLSDSGTLLNTHLGLILVNVAFQTGFCAFVLSNYMKTIPRELYGVGRSRRGRRAPAVLPVDAALCRPPLAALATLEVTWIYNEFFWRPCYCSKATSFR